MSIRYVLANTTDAMPLPQHTDSSSQGNTLSYLITVCVFNPPFHLREESRPSACVPLPWHTRGKVANRLSR